MSILADVFGKKIIVEQTKKEPMENKFKFGDVVRHKSNLTIKMVIVDLPDDGCEDEIDRVYDVTWITDYSKVKNDNFLECELEKFPAES